MGFFKSFKGEKQLHIVGNDPEPAHESHITAGENRHLFGHPTSTPLPQSLSAQQTPGFQPPIGPPPSHASSNPPPYHDWTSIPDTALLPPPPSISNVSSPTNNASYDEAARAHAWCDQNPPYTPSNPSPTLYDAVQSGAVSFGRPREFSGTLKQASSGTYHVQSKRYTTDTLLLSNLPLYFATADSPLLTERSKTIYFEVRVLRIANADSTLAIGFCAKPYPSWRQPGWNRASLGVHSDDGRRFVNDSWGGVDFTEKFEEGDVVGLGITFHAPEGAGASEGGTVKTEAFFTRNGTREGSWWMDEERDAERDEGVTGLQGELDMYAAVGVCGAVEFEVMVGRDGWRHRGAGRREDC